MKIIVTGGTRGIGRAIVNRFRAFGHRVYTLANDEEADIQLDLAEPHDDIIPTFMEVSDCDLLIHCAGINLLAPHGKITDDQMIQLFRVNALSTYFLTELFQPSIVCSIVSDAAWTPMTHSLAYNVSKAAQYMVVKQMAHERKCDDMIIFGVAPGKVSGTKMSDYIDHTFPPMRGWTYEQGRDYQLNGLKTGEIDPYDIADFLVKLCVSPSKHYHGHIFSYGG